MPQGALRRHHETFTPEKVCYVLPASDEHDKHTTARSSTNQGVDVPDQDSHVCFDTGVDKTDCRKICGKR